MSYEIEYNARSTPAADIARSFVPPEPHFVRLLSRNHTLVLGPRGSGKTTLLKMLTVRALRHWNHVDAIRYSSDVSYNAAFVPADIAWGKQLDSLVLTSSVLRRKEAAFVLHTLRALVHSMREASELARENSPTHLKHLSVDLPPDREEKFVHIISESFGIRPALNSLLGLEVSLEARLDSINSGESDDSFSVESFPTKISMLVSTFNAIIGDDDRRWALLFDELEIAPTSIKSFLLSGIRSFNERVVIKLAMAPYMEDAGFERTPTSPQPLHDYHTIQLTYPNKEDATQFSAQLFITSLKRLGVEADSLSSIFQTSEGASFGRRLFSRRKNKSIPTEFLSLAKKDSSFERYTVDRNLFSPSYRFTENNIARDIRKVLPIVIARDYYLRRFEGAQVAMSRSRKSYELYTGFPSIVEITEGNPRAILTLIGPLIQHHLRVLEQKNAASRISVTLQSQAVRRVELLLTSLLQVIPLDIIGFDQGKGLLGFVDRIGRSLEARLLRRPFSPDYIGTFVLDDGVEPSLVSAIGKALNAGALIHVPYPEGGSDSLLRGIIGQRFRLSYALAARYRLLLTLGDHVNLSRLLSESRGFSGQSHQPSLFEADHADD
jgi:hypothetical protein